MIELKAVLEIFHLSSAIKIRNKARDVGLNVTFSTPGDGNCFYHAVVECLNHKSSPVNINHTDLRNSVVDYVRCNRISEFVLRGGNKILIVILILL